MDKIEKMFLDLNSVLVKFWIEQGRPDKELKIALLERMLNWYKKMGYVTPQSISEEPDKSLEEEINRYLEPIHAADIQFEPFTQMTKCARHFAEWGADHLRDSTKMVDKGLEEAAIDFADNARKELFTKDYAISSIADYDHGCIDGFIAGAKWQEKRDEETIKTAEDHAFLAGADWQKEQILKKAKDGYVSAIIIHNDGDEEHYAVTYPNGERPHSITD